MKVLRISGLVLMVLFLAVGGAHAQTVEEYYDKGVEYGAQGKFEEAEKEFKKVPEVDQFYYASAKESLKLLEEALEKRVENEGVICLFKGIAYSRKGMLDEAIAEFKKAIAINLNFTLAHSFLGAAYSRKGMLDEEIAEHKKAIAIDPNFADAHTNLGAAYSSKGMLDEKIAEFKKAITINPNLAEAHYNLAVIYYYKGQYNLAIEHCDKVVKLGYEAHQLLEKLKPYRK